MLDSVRMLFRFNTGLRKFFNSTLSHEACRRIVVESIRDREASFLDLLRRAVYENPGSPYLALLKWAGAEFGDVADLVRQAGVEAALERLHDAGVHIRLDEFKGRRPMVRAGLNLPVKAEDFDNPLLLREFEVATSGSSGRRRRLAVDLDLLVYEAAYARMIEECHGVFDRPKAIWRPVPPGSSGLKAALWAAKCGRALDKWFSPSRIRLGPRDWTSAVFVVSAVSISRLCGAAIPKPAYVPLDEAWRIAEWMSREASSMRPAYLSATASGVVRICQAALARGLDVAGSIFRVTGEPYTDGKRQAVASCGAGAFSGWAVAECGSVAGGCSRREAIDDMHLLAGKIAVIQRPVPLREEAGVVEAFHLSTLRRESPKVMLNVDVGDHGVISRRRCGCPLEELGMPLHVHSIRNYEKLTTGGMHIPGSDILELVEEVLPRLHGGALTDYQFVEEVGGAGSHIAIVVSRRVPNLDESALLRDVRAFLAGKSRAQRMMMNLWEQAGSLRVVREAPHTTPTGKTPPLRVVVKREAEA